MEKELAKPSLEDQIETELERVVGSAGVSLHYQQCEPHGRYVRIETAEAVWGMPPEDLLRMLSEMPDRAGILALRQAADQHPAKWSCP
jgi:hypothetical protein